ncbi:MAG: zinc-ribbon domain-containing protein [Pelagibacteraceae bacterium]|nr:zinc-ribbon domain-containing protein [Pelagibacteraceae bacterium]
MLVNCNSCQKKFSVPDSAITEAGRLLQCGSCGNKWMQYPIKKEKTTQEETKKEKSTTSTNIKSKKPQKFKDSSKKKKRSINLYSEEYLKKKHGLEIKNPSTNKNKIKISPGSNFLKYLIISIVLLLAIFGILNLTKEMIVIDYPLTEPYINLFYQTIEDLKIIILSFVN